MSTKPAAETAKASMTVTKAQVLKILDSTIEAHHPDPKGSIRAQDGLSEYGEGAVQALEAFKSDFVAALERLR